MMGEYQGTMHEYPKCILESPFRAKSPALQLRNIDFARNVCRSLVKEGFNPIASHLFYTQFLDDANERERFLGISLGFQWGALPGVSHVIFALRPKERMSKGMRLGMAQWKHCGKIILVRQYLQTGKHQMDLPIEEIDA